MSKSTQVSGCRVTGCFLWLVSVSFKLSSLVVILALLATVYNMRLEADISLQSLQQAEDNLAFAIQQKDSALGRTTDSTKQMNKLQTDLANKQAELQKLQVELSKTAGVGAEVVAAKQEAAYSKQQIEQLMQKLKEAEAASAAQQQLGRQLSQLQTEKTALEQQLSQVQSELQQTKAQVTAGEQQKEQLQKTVKGHDDTIRELQSSIAKLEQQLKAAQTEIQSNLKQAKQEHDELRHERDELQKQLDKVEVMWDETHQSLLEAAEKRQADIMKFMEGKVAKKSNELKAMEEHCKRRKRQLEENAARVQRNWMDANAWGAKMEVDLQKANQQVNLLHQQNDELTVTMGDMAYVAKQKLNDVMDQGNEIMKDCEKYMATAKVTEAELTKTNKRYRVGWLKTDKALIDMQDKLEQTEDALKEKEDKLLKLKKSKNIM